MKVEQKKNFIFYIYLLFIMHKNAHKKINNTAYKKWFFIYKSSSFKFSRATLTASTTKAVKVQSFPFIASSTSSIILLGNLMHLLVVGGIF